MQPKTWHRKRSLLHGTPQSAQVMTLSCGPGYLASSLINAGSTDGLFGDDGGGSGGLPSTAVSERIKMHNRTNS